MRRLPRRTDNLVQEVREILDRIVVLESEPSLVAAALNQVSWHIYDARRSLVKDLRARGLSWGEVGTTMGISRQSAHRQWGSVDGELLANIAAGYRQRGALRTEDEARARDAELQRSREHTDPFVHVAGQLSMDDADADGPLGRLDV